MDNIVKYGCLNPSEDEDDDMPEADGPADDEPLTANSFIVRKVYIARKLILVFFFIRLDKYQVNTLGS